MCKSLPQSNYPLLAYQVRQRLNVEGLSLSAGRKLDNRYLSVANLDNVEISKRTELSSWSSSNERISHERFLSDRATSSALRFIPLRDLYSFHRTEQCARQTYDEVCRAYERIFDKLELKCYKGTKNDSNDEIVECDAFSSVPADSGLMGGSINHEYLAVSTVGEDTIQICSKYESPFFRVESSQIGTCAPLSYLDVIADFLKIVNNVNTRISPNRKPSNLDIAFCSVIGTQKRSMPPNHHQTLPLRKSKRVILLSQKPVISPL